MDSSSQSEPRDDDDTERNKLDELAAKIRNIAGVADEDDGARQHRHNVYNAKANGDTCAKCGRKLAPDEPVWRSRLDLGRSAFGGRHIRVAPVCAGCKSIWELFNDPEPCQGCGRPVHYRYEFISRRLTFCCERCRQRAQQGAMRDARRAARAGRTCDQCGKVFEPTRTDARFCSVACKQKAYRDRHRVTDDAPRARRASVSRNARRRRKR
jgi:hypothetical protein